MDDFIIMCVVVGVSAAIALTTFLLGRTEWARKRDWDCSLNILTLIFTSATIMLALGLVLGFKNCFNSIDADDSYCETRGA